MKKKEIKYLVKLLEKVRKLNNKSFDKMISKDTDGNKKGLRNSEIEDHLEDALNVLRDNIYGELDDFSTT